MKKIVSSLFLVLFAVSCSNYSGPSYQATTTPSANGTEVEIVYDPAQTSIGSVDHLNAYALVFGNGHIRSIALPVQEHQGAFKITYAAADTASGALIWFKGDNEASDLNEGRGYVVPFNASTASYYLDLAVAYQQVDLYQGIEISADSISNWVDKGLSQNPDLIYTHLPVLGRTTTGRAATDARKEAFEKQLREIFDTGNLDSFNQESLENLVSQATSRKWDAEREAAINVLESKYPTSQVLVQRTFSSAGNLTTVDEWLSLADKMEKDFPGKPSESLVTSLHTRAISALSRRKSIDSLLTVVLPRIKTFNTRIHTSLIEALRDTLPAETIKWADANIAYAEQKAAEGLNAEEARNNKADTDTFLRNQKSALATAYLAKARILEAAGNYDAAFDYASKAIATASSKNAQLVDTYSRIINAKDAVSDHTEILKEFVRESANTAFSDSLLKASYGNDATGYERLRSQLATEADAYLIQKVRGKMIDRPAPDFELYDTKGNLVKLSDYRGKAVVVDFWATWCGPCIASFPDMQKAKAKLNEDDVHFLFVHTWDEPSEEDKSRADIADAFMQERGYPEFHTLIDEDDTVCSIDYMVRGIPTKFIVSPEGRIAFKSIGFNSNAEYMERELRSMLALSKNKNAAVPIAVQNVSEIAARQ